MRRAVNPNSPEEVRRAIQKLTRQADDTLESVGYIQFDTTYSDGSAVGKLQWNSDVGTLEFGLPGGNVNLQLGQEFLIPVRNITGGTLLNGRLVYYTGVDSGLSTVDYADSTRANWPKALVRGILTEDIVTGSSGYMLIAGLIHDVDTFGYTQGVHLYLSTAGDGTYTNTRPTAPDYVMGIGTVKEVSATVGTIQIEFDRLWDLEWASNVHFSPATEEGQYLGWNPENSRYELQLSQRAFFNGTFRETFDALMYSTDGNDLFLTLEQADGGGDLTMQFSDGDETLDCTPAIEIAITPGTDASPTGYMAFIPQSTKVLTIDSAWPTAEHIKVAYLFVPSAQFVFDHAGPYVNQNHNDHLHNGDLQGHLAHLTAKIRSMGAGYYSGVNPEGVDVSYFTYPGASDIRWESSAGVISQLHPQAFDAQDTASTILIVTNGTTPYEHIQNLFTGITEDSLGNAIINNRYFSLVFWGVANKTGDANGIMCNLPSGNYTLEASALIDSSKYSDFSFPREFDIDSSTAFLICRSTFKMGTTGWTHIETEDLRGVSNPGGGSVSGVTDHGALGGLTDDDHTQYHNDARAVTWLAANHETTYNHANFATAYGWGDHAGLYDPAGTMTTHESTYNHANFATAFGWGDHGVAGYLTAETDPIVGAVSGIVKADGASNISAAVAGTDYLAPDGNGSSLTGIIFAQIGSTPTTLAGYGITDGAGVTDHGALDGLADDDHAVYHTDARAVTWLAAGHETTYDHNLIGSAPAYVDDVALNFGDAPDYWLVYNSSSTQLELWSTNIDGGDSDGLVLSVPDGQPRITCAGLLSLAVGGARALQGNSTTGFAVFGNATASGAGVRGQSDSGAGVYGSSESNTGLRGESITGTGFSGNSQSGVGAFLTSDSNFGLIAESGGNSSAWFKRNVATPATPSPVVIVEQNHASDPGNALTITVAGSGAAVAASSAAGDAIRGTSSAGICGNFYRDVTTPSGSPVVLNALQDNTADTSTVVRFQGNNTSSNVDVLSLFVGASNFAKFKGDGDVDFTGNLAVDGRIQGGQAAASTTYGVKGTSIGTGDDDAGIFGQNDSSGTGVYAVSAQGTGLYSRSYQDRAGHFYRNVASPSTGNEVVFVHQDYASSSGVAMVIRQDGSDNTLELKEGATTVAEFSKDGIIKTAGYKSSDGTAGATADYSIGGGTLHVKNGLVTGFTP